ncbi:uncharacterized protein LOC135388776 [Ornithodoros turicata]|uniref:uncharacterized protein LOC135388776 n=1 Tax=Ornithodoros turicata TaxID=34597 RepID=UPI00313A066E
MPKYWFIAFHAIFLIVLANSRHHGGRRGAHYEEAFDCAQIVADYLSSSDKLKSYEVQEYSESLDGNTLDLKKGFLTGFTDIEAVQADLYDTGNAYELSMVLEVPELELSSYNFFECYDGSYDWLHVNVAAKNARFRLGLRYNEFGLLEVFDSVCEGFDKVKVYIDEEEVHPYEDVVSELSRNIFESVLSETVPEAFALVGTEGELGDMLIDDYYK